jgi:hypothetical protein
MARRNAIRMAVIALTAGALAFASGPAKANDLVSKDEAYVQSWDKNQVTKARRIKKLVCRGGEWVITGEVYLKKEGTYKVIGGFVKGYATWHKGTISRTNYFAEQVIRGEAGQTIRFTLRFREPPLNDQMDVKLFTAEAVPITKG